MTNAIETMKALTIECQELANTMVTPIIERGFKDLNEEEKARILGFLNATVELVTETYEWSKGERTYESWYAMLVKTNTNEKYLSLDPSGRMGEIAKEILTLDLHEYFETEVKDLAIDPLSTNFTIDMTKKVIEMIESGVTPEDLA